MGFTFQGQYYYGENIVERYGSDDHQGSHPCAVVHIVNKSQSQDRGTAAVRRLDKGAFSGIILHKKLCQSPYGKYDAESDGEAEEHISSVKAVLNIIFCQVFKHQRRKSGLENEPVSGLGEMIINYM